MKQLYVLIILFFLTLSTKSYSQGYEWAGTYNGIGEVVVRDIYVDNNQDIFSTGYFSDTADFDLSSESYELTSNGFFDVFIQKSDADGNMLWVKGFGGPEFEYGLTVRTDSQDNAYIMGVFSGTVDFDPGPNTFELSSNAGSLDIFIVKLDTDGNFINAIGIGGADYEESTAMRIDDSDNVILAGYFFADIDLSAIGGPTLDHSFGFGSGSFLIKIDENGNYLDALSFGGDDTCLALDFEIAANNEVYIAGIFSGAVDFDPDENSSIVVPTDQFSSASFILKLDSDWNYNYVYYTFAGFASPKDIKISQNQSSVYITGEFNDEVVFDPTNNPQGTTFESMTHLNAFLVSINATSGVVEWANHISSNSGAALGMAIESNVNNEVLLTGFFENETDFSNNNDPNFQISPVGINSSPQFLARFNPNDGAINAIAQFGGVSLIDDAQMQVDSDNDIIIGSHFDETIDLDPSPDTERIVDAVQFRDSFIMKLSNSSLSTEDLVFSDSDLSFFPNPATEVVQILHQQTLVNETFSIFDITGKVVLSGTISTQNKIDISQLIPGLYMLNVLNTTSKLIKN